MRFALGREGYQCVEPPIGPVVVIVEEVVLRVEKQLPQFYFWACTYLNFELKCKVKFYAGGRREGVKVLGHVITPPSRPTGEVPGGS